MATVHGVVQQNGDGSPVLGAGQLLSTASLRELARQLGTGCPVEFLPDHVVARTPDLLAWWTPAAVQPMFFRAGSELEESLASSFRTQLCCSSCETAFCMSERFRRTGGRVQTPNWPQRPTGTQVVTGLYVPHDAHAKVVNGDFTRPMAASILPKRIYPSGRRRPPDKEPGRDGGALEKRGREGTVSAVVTC
jgi:hypothetical protein